MKRFARCIALWLAGSCCGFAIAKRPPNPWRLPPALVQLAAQARYPRGWTALRLYARRERNPLRRGLAWLALGYREYQARQFNIARDDLLLAAATRFEFAGVSTYLAAQAAWRANEPSQVVSILSRFGDKYPASFERLPARRLLAAALVRASLPERALETLADLPRNEPADLLMRAQAEEQLNRLKEAALADQAIFYGHPNSPQAEDAARALTGLRVELGASFPAPSIAAIANRAEGLYRARRYRDALDEYNRLLAASPSGLRAWQWNLARARSMVALGEPQQAVETLVAVVAPAAPLEAERLEILADAYSNEQDEGDLLAMLDELQRDYPRSDWYASALSVAAYYFMTQGNWDRAGRFYGRLLDAFPGGSLSELASWRIAWINDFEGHRRTAEQSLVRFIERYPRSPRVPAALFYLGRLEADEGNASQARAVYRLLERRYIHDFYAFRAAERMRALPQASAHATSAPAIPVALIARSLPALPRLEFDPCGPASAPIAARPALALASLDLTPLAVEVLRAQIADETSNSALRRELADLQASAGEFEPALRTAAELAPEYLDRHYSALTPGLWQLLYPRAHWTAVRRFAFANRLSPYLVMAVIRQESAFNPSALSPAGAIGLMQILPSTVGPWRYRWTYRRRLENPAFNLRFGCAYLRRMLDRFHGNAAEAIAAYNAGDERVAQWLLKFSPADSDDFIQMIPFPATRWYVRAVLRDASIYRELMGGARFRECPQVITRGRHGEVLHGQRERG